MAARHLGYRGTASDITDLSERERSILAAKEAAEQASRSKTKFLANMSHELRTPLNAIIGFSDMMALAIHGPMGAPAYEQYAADINGSAKHLLSIINDILDIAKIEAGRLDLIEEETPVASLCDVALRLMQERAHEHDVDLRFEPAPNLPNVLIDQRAMRQVLLNLLSNAVKFTKAGGEVTLRAQLSMEGELLLQVCDTGIGMREEDLHRVLEPFVQLENELTRQYRRNRPRPLLIEAAGRTAWRPHRHRQQAELRHHRDGLSAGQPAAAELSHDVGSVHPCGIGRDHHHRLAGLGDQSVARRVALARGRAAPAGWRRPRAHPGPAISIDPTQPRSLATRARMILSGCRWSACYGFVASRLAVQF